MKNPNVILVNPSLAYDGNRYEEVVFPFTSIMVIATILDRHGYKVNIVDGNRYSTDECIAHIARHVDESTIYVGFSVMTSQVAWAYRVTTEIKKKFPHLRVIWGGAHPTLYPEQTIADKAIDAIAINESSSIIIALTKAMECNDALSSVPGICFKSNGGIIKTPEAPPDDINSISDMDFSLFDVDYYSHDNMLSQFYEFPVNDVVSLPILTGLGCAYKCTFCINVILNRKYRFKPVEEIVDRIEYLQKTYGAVFFQFLDEDFFLNKKRILDFIDLVEKKKLKFYFRPWLRVSYFRDNYISSDVARRLEKIGMLTAVMGAESGSQAVLDKIQKQIKVEDTIRAAEVLSKTGIIPRFSMMVGLPGETKEDILATYRLALRIKEIDKRAEVPVLNFVAYPGSLIYREAIKKYNLGEPSTLADWAKVDFSGHLGFYAVRDRPWIEDKIVFNRMNYYYNIGFQFSHSNSRINDFLHDILRFIVRLRFRFGFFSFPFEDYLLKFHSVTKSKLKCNGRSGRFKKINGE